MIKPAFLKPDDQPTTVGRVFGTPMVVMGWTWLPVLELAASIILSWVAGRKRPDWSVRQRVYAGTASAVVMLGSEWMHNLAHTAVANQIGKPVDAIRVMWGTPLLIYYDINDQDVTPRQHIQRASGGPLINALLVPVSWVVRRLTPRDSVAHYVANFAFGTNCVLSTVSLVPIPGIDGGPMLKWSLVESGQSLAQADETVKGVNRMVGVGLGLAAGVAIKRRHTLLGAALAALAATSLAIGFGLLKEQKK
jgi:Zn-dependent protease